jgi:hypothetical protein
LLRIPDVAGPATARLAASVAPAATTVPKNSRLFMVSSLSADLDGAVLVDGDGIARFDGFEEVVAE